MVTFALVILLTQEPVKPPSDSQQARTMMASVALARSADDIPPIPLEPGSTARGMAFDTYRLIALAARKAAPGVPMTVADALALELPKALIVAHPLECDGASFAPAGITMIAPRKGVIAADGPLMTGAALEQMLPGVALPPGSVAAAFSGGLAVTGVVSIAYEGAPCGGNPVRLPLTPGNPKKIADFKPTWPLSVRNPPDGTVAVRIEAVIGVDGIPANLRVLSPPSEFNLPAAAAVRQWRYEPMTLNGAPLYVPIVMTVTVTFSRR